MSKNIKDQIIVDVANSPNHDPYWLATERVVRATSSYLLKEQKEDQINHDTYDSANKLIDLIREKVFYISQRTNWFMNEKTKTT